MVGMTMSLINVGFRGDRQCRAMLEGDMGDCVRSKKGQG